jgi:hypothetical protein
MIRSTWSIAFDLGQHWSERFSELGLFFVLKGSKPANKNLCHTSEHGTFTI